MYEPGDLKVFNPNKEISREIILEVLIRHRDALKQARTGEIVGTPMDKIEDNQRKINQVRGLNLIISAQREMITISRPIIFFKSMQKWKKDYKTEKKEEIPPFEKEDNDYNQLMYWLDFLKDCEDAIIKAERTKRLDDDYLWDKQTNDDDINELTRNILDM